MIGVIAGSGQLPILICDSLKNDAKPYVVASFSKNFVENIISSDNEIYFDRFKVFSIVLSSE